MPVLDPDPELPALTADKRNGRVTKEGHKAAAVCCKRMSR